MLSGNLELFALADVLRFVARSGATGGVNIYRGTDGGRILLSDGEVVGAVVDDFAPDDPDGVVDAAMRLFDGGGGEFALELGAVSGPTRLPVEELLKLVGRRRAEWRKILASVGSLDGPLDVTAQVPAGTEEINLTPLEWHIAVLSDGHRSLRDIAHEAGASAFSVATALLAMSNAGLLSLPGSPGSTAEDVEEEEPDEESGHAADFDYDDEADEPAVAEEDQPEEDLDPAELLRELGEPRSGPRGRRMAPPTREEQRLRLRTR